MAENILVVEYEPRYTDRVRQALNGQPFVTIFARDGEEAMKALDSQPPTLIVLSSVVPKISTTELIRAIRGRKPLAETPILLTVSGYNGKSPRADAQRVGASDILPKPYSETEFLGKVRQMLGRGDEGASAGFTSNQIFGELLDDDEPTVAMPAAELRKPMATKPNSDIDKMLADTLSGITPQKKKDAPVAPLPAAGAKPKTQSGSVEFDKLLSDTLSGLQPRKQTSPGSTPIPPAPPVAPPPAPTPAPAAAAPPPAPKPAPAPAPQAPPEQRFNTEKMQAYVPDRVPVSQPVFTPATPPPAARVEEEEPTDGTKFGQYVLLEKIATGGMAEVWKSRMRGVEGFQKIVAIKKILPHLSDNQDFIEMFVDEAKLAAQLNHNNIIHIYDLGKIQNSYYIAMEYIDGHDLKTILRRGSERDQPMTVELALFIASKVAAALDYAHRKRDFDDRDLGLVHRDVSPQNVLISQEGDIKLCDFGIAKAASKASHTQAGALKGKLQYMSPEQAWGRAIDKRSDVFALAAVLFEMLTGRKLFAGDNELSILEQVREARVTAPSLYNDEVTPEIDRIVIKALQKDPDNRYQTAGEMARDLDAVLYSFRPTPTSADLAIYMHRLDSSEPVMMDEPEPEPVKPVAVPTPAPIPAHTPIVAAAAPAAAAAAMAMPTAETVAHHHDEPKKKSMLPLVAVLAVLILGGAGAFFAMRPRGNAATNAPATQTTSAAAPSAVAPTTAPLTDSTATIVPVPGTAAPALDPSAVDQEVAKRLAAERARLAQQMAAQTATAPPAARVVPAPVTATPPAAAPQVVQQQPAVTQTVAPAPAPVQTQTVAPPVAETRPDPTPAQPAPQQAARAREGDLVPVGTEGLTPPRVVRRGSVPYPPIAKAQRVQGTIIVNVLVSETGQVIETRILRGINGPGGLNQAAEAAMRRSTFAPATKDGVRVRSWISVPVEFKL